MLRVYLLSVLLLTIRLQSEHLYRASKPLPSWKTTCSLSASRTLASRMAFTLAGSKMARSMAWNIFRWPSESGCDFECERLGCHAKLAPLTQRPLSQSSMGTPVFFMASCAWRTTGAWSSINSACAYGPPMTGRAPMSQTFSMRAFSVFSMCPQMFMRSQSGQDTVRSSSKLSASTTTVGLRDAMFSSKPSSTCEASCLVCATLS
mmetsp:Transcript_20521/g.61185  ORF Transcript_20521/g.61185 Transcript_20521/m.61185 type:complete len:205 (+) Transcript_20521:1972-2586(+)